jgi:hypothetical protein
VLSAYHIHKIHSKSESVCLELFVHFEEGHSKMTLHDGLTEYLASLALFGVVLICLPICISLTSLELFNCHWKHHSNFSNVHHSDLLWYKSGYYDLILVVPWV